jgi:hypothetical protein
MQFYKININFIYSYKIENQHSNFQVKISQIVTKMDYLYV